MTFFDDEHGSSQPQRYSKRRRRIGTSLLVVFGLCLGSLAALPSGYVVEQPGPVFNVLGEDGGNPVISITGVDTYPTSGALDLLTVNVQGSPAKPLSFLQLWSLSRRAGSIIVPTDEVYPPDLSTKQVEAQDQQMMQDSQESAKLIALKELGYKVPYKIGVVEIAADSPAKKALRLGDKILSVNGVKVSRIDDLPNYIAAWAKVKPLRLGLIRGSKRLTVEVTPQKRTDGSWRLGIIIANSYEFPFEIKTRLDGIGGPSGGLMFALGIIDKLTPGHLNGGKKIAGTGTIDLDGKVGPIGGIAQKMIGASEQGAQYFFAPKSNCNEVVGHIPAGLEVFSVANIKDALTALDKIAQGASLDSLPTCNAN